MTQDVYRYQQILQPCNTEAGNVHEIDKNMVLGSTHWNAVTLICTLTCCTSWKVTSSFLQVDILWAGFHYDNLWSSPTSAIFLEEDVPAMKHTHSHFRQRTTPYVFAYFPSAPLFLSAVFIPVNFIWWLLTHYRHLTMCVLLDCNYSCTLYYTPYISC